MARHHLDLDGAALLPTRALKLTRLLLRGSYEDQSMAAVYGPAGSGKTFTVETLLEELGFPVVTLDFARRPNEKEISSELLEKLTGVAHDDIRRRLDRQVVELLSATRRLVVIDEAQRLTYEGIEHLRHLHDESLRLAYQQGTEAFGLVLVGGNGCYETLSRYPMLESRISRSVAFEPIDEKDVLTLMPTFHPVLADTDAAVLELIDTTYSNGVMRNWTRFVKQAAELCANAGP